MWDIKCLFLKHAREIDRFLRRNGHNAEVASDLTQDVFLRILASAPPGHDENPRAYLHQVARNLSIDLHRRDKLIGNEMWEENVSPITYDAPGPEKIINDRQRLAIVNRALETLPEKTRQAFELYRLGDMTIAEVAAELDLSVSRTWTLIRRAYLHLRASLDDDVI